MKFVTIVLLLIQFSEAIDLNYFNSQFEKSLKKDQFMDIIIHDRGYKKLLRFRWTLFKNKGLVTLTNYNGAPSQHLLYKRYRQDSIKIPIALRDEETSRYHPYLIITFLGYNYANQSAQFEVLHKDAASQTTIELKE